MGGAAFGGQPGFGGQQPDFGGQPGFGQGPGYGHGGGPGFGGGPSYGSGPYSQPSSSANVGHSVGAAMGQALGAVGGLFSGMRTLARGARHQSESASGDLESNFPSPRRGIHGRHGRSTQVPARLPAAGGLGLGLVFACERCLLLAEVTQTRLSTARMSRSPVTRSPVTRSPVILRLSRGTRNRYVQPGQGALSYTHHVIHCLSSRAPPATHSQPGYPPQQPGYPGYLPQQVRRLCSSRILACPTRRATFCPSVQLISPLLPFPPRQGGYPPQQV
jgi:hypothetical protein